MAVIKFKDFAFREDKDSVRFIFLNIFYFDVKKQDIGECKISSNKIEFKGMSEKKANNLLNRILNKGFSNLKNKLTNNKAIYIHKNSNIPLIGTNYFGIVDRNTNIIELKPITSCNLDCVYCSVNHTKRFNDFVVEKDYLVEETKKLIKFKNHDDIEIHIGTQGEPLLYKDIPDLIKDLKKIKQVKRISIDTNAVLIDKKTADRLINAGITQFNISINAMDNALAKKIADNNSYNIEKIKKIAEYISKKTDTLIAPVLIPKLNEKEIPKIIEFAKKIKAKKGIQNFLCYRHGKNPAKQLTWDEFIKKLKTLEKEHKTKLLFDFKKDFKVSETKALPKPFKKGDMIDAEIVCNGRLKNEKIAVSGKKCISDPNCEKKGKIRLKIARSKHNIFVGISSF